MEAYLKNNLNNSKYYLHDWGIVKADVILGRALPTKCGMCLDIFFPTNQNLLTVDSN